MLVLLSLLILGLEHSDFGAKHFFFAFHLYFLEVLTFLQIVEKLLIAAVVDADVIVRQSVFQSMEKNSGFDEYLAQADSLSAIFVALNDEV